MSDAGPTPFTGWEPDAPIGDTLLRRFLFNWAAAYLGRPAGFANCSTLLRPPMPERLGDVVDALDGFYDFDGETTTGEVMLFSAWTATRRCTS